MSGRVRIVVITLAAACAAALGGSGWGPFLPGGPF